MKAALIGKDIRISDVNLPVLDKDSARVKVLYTGLCGSDMHKVNMQHNNGLQLIGHEFTGRVINILAKSNHLKVGDIVVGNPLLSCQKCNNCLSGNDNLCKEFKALGRTHMGSFAEYIDVPIDNLHVINDMSPRLGVLADVVAVGLHAVDEFIDLTNKSRILIIGDGAIGTMIAGILRLKGVQNVDISGKYQENIEFLNDIVGGITSVKEEKEGYYDYVFETVGGNQNNTVESSVRQVGRRGKIIFLGVFPEQNQIGFNNRDLFLKEASLNASVAYKSKYFLKAIEFLKENKELEKFITHELWFNDFETGINIMNNKPNYSPVIKVIYKFDDE